MVSIKDSLGAFTNVTREVTVFKKNYTNVKEKM